MKLSRTIVATFAALLAVVTLNASAAYPEKALRLVVPYPPGGAGDLMGRGLAEKLAEQLGQNVVPDNKPGAGGIIATQNVAGAAADGYTLLFGSVATHAINLSMYAKLPYDPVKDFIPVGITHAIPRVLVVHPSIPANSVAELIALAKANPGKYTYSTSGIGSTSHLAGVLFASMAGIQLTAVPYKGSAPAVTDLLSGRISLTFDSVAVYGPHIQSGKLRALGVTSMKRIGAMPNVPTIAASGLPGYDVSNWAGVFVPANTPKAVVDRLSVAVIKAMADVEMNKKLVAAGIEPLSSTPEEFAAIIKADIPKWAKVVKDSGAKAE